MAKRVHVAKRRKCVAGFTLLEILMVLAMISILAMVAMPYYQDYRTRSKVSAELSLIGPIKVRVQERYMTTGNWPISNAMAMLDEATSYRGEWVKRIDVGNDPVDGAITITYDNSAIPALGDNTTIVFYPQPDGATILWICDAGSLAREFRPHNCR